MTVTPKGIEFDFTDEDYDFDLRDYIQGDVLTTRADLQSKADELIGGARLYDHLRRVYERAREQYGLEDDPLYRFQTSPGRVNLIGSRGFSASTWRPVRPEREGNTTWDDTLFVVYIDPDRGKTVRAFRYSTQYGTGGTAIIAYGMHAYYMARHHISRARRSIANDSNSWWSGGYRALKPKSGVTVLRDSNRNLSLDADEGYEAGNMSINIHYGGNNPASTANWSEGCQVIVGPHNYRAFIKILEADGSLEGVSDDQNDLTPPKNVVADRRPVIYCLVPGAFLRPQADVTLPLDTEKDAYDPLRYFHWNERGVGGYFPIGLTHNLHSGIHIAPPAPPAEVPEGADPSAPPPSPARTRPIHAAGPGEVVAARLPGFTAGDAAGGADTRTPYSLGLTAGQLGFVLIRHRLRPAEKDSKDVHTYYSLYLHLAPPADAPGLYAAVPWVTQLVSRRFGTVVQIDPAQDAYLQRKVLAEALEGDDQFTTANATVWNGPTKQGYTIGADGDGRLGGVRVAGDERATACLKNLTAGKVVTLAASPIPVAAGEVVGHVLNADHDPKAEVDLAQPSPEFFHWEVLAPVDGSKSGVKAILDLAAKELALGDDFFTVVEEDSGNENNVLEEDSPELQAIVDGVVTHPQEEGEDGDDPLLEYGYSPLRLIELLNDAEWLPFSEPLADDDETPHAGCDPKETLSYPFRIVLSPYTAMVQDGDSDATVPTVVTGKQHVLKAEFVPPIDGVVTSDVAFELPDDGPAEVEIMVPVGTREVLLTCGSLGLKASAKAPEAMPDLEAAYLKRVGRARWRNVLLHHRNEWTEDGVRASVRPRFDNPDAELDPFIKAVAWWQDEAPYDDGSPLFAGGDGGLPASGNLHTPHPVTFTWLLRRLLDRGILEWIEPTPTSGGSTGGADGVLQAVFAGYEPAYPQAAKEVVGATRQALAISRDIPRFADNEVELWAKPASGDPALLGTIPFSANAAKGGSALVPIACPLWGTWSLEVRVGKNDQEKKAQSPAPTALGSGTVDGLAPVLDLPTHDPAAPDDGTTGAEDVHVFTTPPLKQGRIDWQLDFAKNRPVRLRGWMVLRTWDGDDGQQPPPVTDSAWTTDDLAVPADFEAADAKASRGIAEAPGGALSASIDPSKGFAALLGRTPPATGKRRHVLLGLLFVNGKAPPLNVAYDVDWKRAVGYQDGAAWWSKAIEGGGDRLGGWAVSPLPKPLSQPKIGPITFVVRNDPKGGGLGLQCELFGGDVAFWKRAKLEFRIDGKKVYTSVSKKASAKLGFAAYLGKTVEIELAVTADELILDGIKVDVKAPDGLEYDVTPSFCRPEDPANALCHHVGTEKGIELFDEEDTHRLRVHSITRAISPDRDLKLFLEAVDGSGAVVDDGTAEDSPLATLPIEYAQPFKPSTAVTYGRVKPNGAFVAWIDLNELRPALERVAETAGKPCKLKVTLARYKKDAQVLRKNVPPESATHSLLVEPPPPEGDPPPTGDAPPADEEAK